MAVDGYVCSCPVAHPYGQLELDLDGVEPLTDLERSEWVLRVEQPGLDKQYLTAHLTVADCCTRRERATRLRWVLQVQAPFSSEMGWLIPGGAEGAWLYGEACQCFVAGSFIAAVLSAHAACERTLAAHLQLSDLLDRRLERAGLGPIAQAAQAGGLIPTDLLDALLDLNERRKAMAHLKPPLDPAAVMMRVHSEPVREPSDSCGDDLTLLLQRDSELAVILATRVVRGLTI